MAMTKLTTSKAMKREAATPGPRGRPICVEIQGPNLVTLWEKGTQVKYTTTLEACYAMAAKQYANRITQGE